VTMVASRRSAGNRSSCQIRHMSANSLSRRVLLPTLYTSGSWFNCCPHTDTHSYRCINYPISCLGDACVGWLHFI